MQMTEDRSMRRQEDWNARRVTRLGFLVAVGTSLFVLESLVPLPLPFLKIGLANISTLLAVLLAGPIDAFLVVALRVTVGSLLTGSLLSPSFILAAGAGAVSAGTMTLFSRVSTRILGPVGLSLAGSFAHVVTQLALVAFLIVRNAGVFHLLPLLLLTALVGGLVVGLVTVRILPAVAGSQSRIPVSAAPEGRVLRWGDTAAIVLLTCAAAASFAYAPAAQGTTVFIDVAGQTVGRLDLHRDAELTLHGARGDMRIEVHSGKVRMKEADCPNSVCVRSGWKSRSGEIIVCVPNKTVIRIVDEGETAIMGITG
jgi:heptaprenyl diphosphate synthase